VGINCPNIRRCIQIWPKKNSIVGQKWRFASKNQGYYKQSILIPFLFYRQDAKMRQQKKKHGLVGYPEQYGNLDPM
jgi:hypothetical protein